MTPTRYDHERLILRYRLHLAQDHQVPADEIGRYIAEAERMITPERRTP